MVWVERIFCSGSSSVNFTNKSLDIREVYQCIITERYTRNSPRYKLKYRA